MNMRKLWNSRTSRKKSQDLNAFNNRRKTEKNNSQIRLKKQEKCHIYDSLELEST